MGSLAWSEVCVCVCLHTLHEAQEVRVMWRADQRLARTGECVGETDGFDGEQRVREKRGTEGAKQCAVQVLYVYVFNVSGLYV